MPTFPIAVIPDDWPAVLALSPAFAKLREIADVIHYDTLPGSVEGLASRIQEAELVINIRSSSRFTREVFERCARLKLVSLWGTGTDNIDLNAARSRGVTITNTPAVSAPSIAEHALTLMLSVARRIPQQDAAVRRGEWPRGQAMELRGKTLGIIGLGAIGRRFAELGRGLGMRVIAWTMHPNPALGYELVEFDELLRTSEIVSLHLRLSDQTRGMIGAREFGLMKQTAIFVNTARGAIVDETSLIQALSSRQIRGAGLDVFAAEPLVPEHPLTKLDNVVLTPHSAGITPEALEAGLQLAVENVRYFLSGHAMNVVA